jgi:hypothetical protein
LDPLVVRVLAFSSAGWLSAAVCAFAAGWHVRRLARHAPPPVEAVRKELARAGSDAEREMFRADLHERHAEALRALSLATLLPRSLARIALATGTALALTSLAKELPFAGPEVVAGAAVGFIGGFVGMMACTGFGRQAKSLAAEMRQHWKQVARVADGQWTPGKASG